MTARATIIVGPPNAGKSARLLEAYSAAQTEPGPGKCLWLAPSHSAVAQFRDTLAQRQPGPILDPGISTFAHFAEALISASPRRIQPITRLQKRYLLRQVIHETLQKDQLRFLRRVAETPGFLVQLDEWIADLKRRDIWAEDFAANATSPRDRDLVAIYRQYQRRLLEDDLYDAEGRFWAAREILKESSHPDSMEYRLVVVAGFTDFTAAQFDILQLLAGRAEKVGFSLTADPECMTRDDADAGRAHLFGRVRATYDRLRELLPGITVEHLRAVPVCTPLAQLERNLFREEATVNADTVSASPAIEIISASSERREIQELARRIKVDLYNHRASPQDFLAVFPQLAEAAGQVAEVFTDFGIPYWIESVSRLAQSPLMRVTLSLLRLERDDWPFRRVLEVVSNRLLTVFDQTGDGDVRAELEIAVRSAQLPSGKHLLLQQLRGNTGNPPADDVGQRSATFAGISSIEHLASALDRLPAQAAIPEWIAGLSKLLAEVGVDVAGGFASDWQSLERGLHSVATCVNSGVETIGLAEFLDVFEMVSADLPLPGTAESVGRVRVVTPEFARHFTAPHVFLAGLSEQSFFSLPRVDRLSPESGHSDAGDAMHLFYSVVTRASEKLTLSYPALDDKGQQLPPSPFIDELRRCFVAGAISETCLPLGEKLADGAEPLSRSGWRQFAVARALDNDQRYLAGLQAQPSMEAQGILDGIVAIASRGSRDHFGPFEGIFESDAARAILAQRFDARHHWSPSQLESYATCSFRFLGENLLGLRILDDLAVTDDPGRRGSLLHHVLAAIHAQLLEQPVDALTDEAWNDEDSAWKAELALRFQRALNARVEATTLEGVEGSLREIERRQVVGWAEQYARQELEYRRRWSHLDEPPRPAYFEVRFGPEVRKEDSSAIPGASTPLPFEFDLGDEKILITGQIDRVDVGRVAGITILNVIDYKSGRQVRLQHEHLQAGRQLQLPLYALAAEEHVFRDLDARALAAGYWSVRGTGFEKGHLELRNAAGESLSDSEMQLRSQVRETVRALVTGLRAGQFPVFNTDPHCTRWCDLSTICRVAQIRSLEKVWPPTEAPPQ